MRLFRLLPYWVKTGLVTGAFFMVLMFVLPERFSNLAYLPWYLAWLVLPAFIIFSVLCIVFRIDFVSNYHPSEGLFRPVMLSLLSGFSYFLVAFAIGAVLALLLRKALKKRT